MFIQVETLIYIDSVRGYEPMSEAIINTDKIVDIQPAYNKQAWIIDCGGTEYRYVISNEEFTRVQALLMGNTPLLTNEPAPPLAYRPESSEADKAISAFIEHLGVLFDEYVPNRFFKDGEFRITDEKWWDQVNGTIVNLIQAHLSKQTPPHQPAPMPSALPAVIVDAWNAYQEAEAIRKEGSEWDKDGSLYLKMNVKRKALIDVISAYMPQETDNDN